MAKSRSARRKAALLRAGFSPEPSATVVLPEPVAQLVLEPAEPYVEVPIHVLSSPDTLEMSSDVSVSPLSTPAVSLFSSSVLSTPKISPAADVPDEHLSENIVLFPTYTPSASTSRLREYQLGDAAVSHIVWNFVCPISY